MFAETIYIFDRHNYNSSEYTGSVFKGYFSSRIESCNRKFPKKVTFQTHLNGILIEFKPPNKVAQASWQLTLANKEALAVKHLTRLSYRKKNKHSIFTPPPEHLVKFASKKESLLFVEMNHPFTEVFLLQMSKTNVGTRTLAFEL